MAKPYRRMVGPVEMTSPTDPNKIERFTDWVNRPGNAEELLRPMRPGERSHKEGGAITKGYAKGGKIGNLKSYSKKIR